MQEMIPVYEPSFGREEEANLLECIRSGWISGKGMFVERFEELFAEYVGVNAGVSTSNGTTALHLALHCHGIGRGDEVVVPSLSYIASANCVRYTGAKPVFCDVDEESLTLDVESFKEKITGKTKAVIPVHLYGHPCDMDAVNEVAQEHGLKVIEDAAEAHGSKYNGKLCGSLGDSSCFSFFANKTITCGEGGMILSDDHEFLKNCRLYRGQGSGSDNPYRHDVIGFNYRMTNMQAAVGVAQLGKISEILKRKKKMASWYENGLSGVPGIRAPVIKKGRESNYWLYHVRVAAPEKLAECLTASGVESRPGFTPLHKQKPYSCGESLPVSEAEYEKILCLPSSPELTEEDAEFICGIIRDWAD